MSLELTAPCPSCAKRTTLLLSADNEPHCQGCGKPLLPYLTDDLRDEIFAPQCPVCGAAHLYRQKDFNRRLGVTLVVVGIALAYFTYGLSLLAVTLIDWFLFRRVKEVGCCYRCGLQLRKSPLVAKLEPFSLQLHDYYRNLKE